MSNIVPRFRGRAFQKENKAWAWELIISIGDEKDLEPLCYHSKQDFLNKATALSSLQKMLPGLMRDVCKAAGLPEPSGLIDLKKGVSMPLEEYGVE